MDDRFSTLKETMDSYGPPGGSDDEDSFVVLETSSPSLEKISYESSNSDVQPLFRTQKVREIQSLINKEISQLDNMPHVPSTQDPLDAVASTVAKITISPDSSFEEIQKQVEELIKENETLKNVIVQNNLSMKEHFTRFEQYRNGVDNAMKSYKEKFNQAKSYIDTCKEENTKIINEREGYIELKKLHEEEILNLKERLRSQDKSIEFVSMTEQNAKVDELQTELARAHLKIAELEIWRTKSEELSCFKEQATEKLKNLHSDIENANLQITELKKQNEKAEAENEILKNNSETATKSGEAFQECEKLQKKQKILEKVVADYKNMVDALNEESKKMGEEKAKHLQLIKKYEDEILTKQQEVNAYELDLSAMRTKVTHMKTENEDLRRDVATSSKESEKLVKSASLIPEYDEKLRAKDDELKHYAQKLASSTAEYEDKLRAKDDELKRYVQMSEQDIVETIVKSDEIKCLQIKLKEAQEKYTSIKEDYIQVRQQLSLAQQTITAMETETEKKNQEIEKLRKMIQQVENDEIFALKEQLNLYKSDYEAEKESKTALKRDKDQIAEDLQKIQMRNKQLQNEVETMRARNQPKAEGYTCPKCSFAFNNYQSLENHVHRCLDLEGFP